MKFALAALLLLCGSALAQTSNVTPSPADYLLRHVEYDLRLKGPTANAAGDFPTVKLEEGRKQSNWSANRFTATVACWNKSATCPPVNHVSVRVYFNAPGYPRTNVTWAVGLCGFALECTLPVFPAISAKPGEAYRFWYTRINARWVEPPKIIVAP